MDKVIIEALKQSPMALALVVVFWLLIKYLVQRDKTGREYHADQLKQQREAYTEIILTQRTVFNNFHMEHLDARSEARKSLDYNTAALEKTASATNANNLHLTDLAKSIDRLANKQV